VAAPFVIEPLGSEHDRAGFSCGVESLDRYFRQQARQDVQRSVAAVYVLRGAEASVVLGYYTLSSSSVELLELPPDVSRRLPRYPVVPAFLIGRLAVDERSRGQRLGQRLLLDAAARCHRLSQEVGAVAILVDAIDDAARGSYERYGFRRFPRYERRLFLPMQEVGRLIGG